MANMIISCPSCPQKLRVPEELFGRAVKCPKCGATFEAAGPRPDGESAEARAAARQSPADAPPSSETLERQPEALPVSDEPRPRKIRRDAEPSRGTLILTMGIFSIVLPAIGWIPGIMAIVMGRTDLKKIKAGQMDRSGADVTQAGWICGIVGACLQGITCIGCGVYITFVGVLIAGMGKSGAFNPKANKPGVKQVGPMAPMVPPGPQGPGNKM